MTAMADAFFGIFGMTRLERPMKESRYGDVQARFEEARCGGGVMTPTQALWTCTVPGRPGTKGNSHRVMKRGGHLSISPSAASQKNERAAREVIASERPTAPFDGALYVNVVFVFAVPESKRKGKHKIDVGTPCLLKVDRGNLLKLIEDAMTGLVYADDSQVVGGNVTKVWGETQGTHIAVYRVDPMATAVRVLREALVARDNDSSFSDGDLERALAQADKLANFDPKEMYNGRI